ncbi:hypothetical protein AJ79_06689 [Helicocarpus griseus UAMH5409]|uniref:Histone chaperone domain-containing protein n=1 Tax=Helicocarpus griseus UAMH5409 TaxID=1447875 RepID=A0A2B7XAX3_9EURO|nr:hypothetical protein AJ79_06689 [Helicocarpus griseus UAMH5409]
MSNPTERRAEDLYEAEHDPEEPVSGVPHDSSYATKQDQPLPVQSDQAPVEDSFEPGFANTNEQLARDEQEAINPSNIMKGSRTRHAKPQAATKYSEGPGEEDLPAEVENTGQSDTRGM